MKKVIITAEISEDFYPEDEEKIYETLMEVGCNEITLDIKTIPDKEIENGN